MRRASTALLAATLLGALAAPSGAADGALRQRLLEDLSSEAAAVREQAARRIESDEGLAAEDLLRALRRAPARSRPLLFRLAALRGVREATPDLVEGALGADVAAAEAAIRALVTLGADAVAAGRAALADASRGELSAETRDARLRRLKALDVQRRVEHDVLSRWRRKGGSYRGRYAALAEYGWDAQPVLLAMLLDVPLEDRFVVIPTTGDPELDRIARQRALTALAESRFRGYRTFHPLPPTIQVDEMFDLAYQALADVADLSVMRDVLLDTYAALRAADEALDWRPRPFEKYFAHDIAVILAFRGDPGPLQARRQELESEVASARRLVARRDAEDDPEYFQLYATRLGELAGVLHQLEEYERAAARYGEALAIHRKLTGRESALNGYNRACALARAGRTDEALEQLAKALDPELSMGRDDLTREWVAEDGDLEPLRADPRFEQILDRSFPVAPDALDVPK